MVKPMCVCAVPRPNSAAKAAKVIGFPFLCILSPSEKDVKTAQLSAGARPRAALFDGTVTETVCTVDK